MRNNLSLILFILVTSTVSFGQVNVRMRYEDKIRIREAIHISNQFGGKIWKGITEVPFVILLVSDSVEFLINHPYPSNDFRFSENDTILNTQIFFRSKQFPEWYLATFPAVNGVNCVVVGTPEKTGKNSTEWVITLLHEHFHQYQYTDSDYYQSVDKLELSGGDQTGMWQLNYAFPYDDAAVNKQYKKYIFALSQALHNYDKRGFSKYFKKYQKQRTKFKDIMKPADYKYFSFQVWQEGIARYTEYKFLEVMMSAQSSVEMTQLPDFISFKSYMDRFCADEQKSLIASKLNIDKRICFYSIGFAEGILLDKMNPKWHEKYLAEKFFIEKFFNN